jgi:hypothetical protein
MEPSSMQWKPQRVVGMRGAAEEVDLADKGSTNLIAGLNRYIFESWLCFGGNRLC